MLGKLTRYELKKQLGGKFFLITLCLLLAVNVVLNCGIDNYLELKEVMADVLPEGEFPDFWSQKESSRERSESDRENFARLNALPPEAIARYEQTLREQYGEDVMENCHAYPELGEFPGLLFKDQIDVFTILQINMQREWNQKIADGQERVVRSARNFGREALAKGDNYGVRRNLDIIRLYSRPRVTANTPVGGWDLLLKENFSMLLVSLMLLLACSGSVSGEHDRQTWLLLHTARCGKGKTLAAKYLAGILSAVGLTLLFRLAALGGICFQVGLLGSDQPIQMLEDFPLVPYTLTVGQYARIHLVCQMFAAALLSVLMTTLSALCRTSVISYGAGALTLGVFLLPVYFPPQVEWLSGPLALAEPIKYFDAYYTANLFGFPVLWVLVQAVLWCALAAGCMYLAHRVYHRKRGVV